MHDDMDSHVGPNPQCAAATQSASLCKTCIRAREIVSGKGSRFLLCELSQSDSRFPKYPPQPVNRCDGYVTDQAREKKSE
jgi:hypothetical protein